MDALATFLYSFEEKERALEARQHDLAQHLEVIQRREENLAFVEEVQAFMQELAEEARKEVSEGLEVIVTRCLQSVFGPELSFKIEIDTKRSNTAIEFWVIDSSVPGPEPLCSPPSEDLGGGIVDTVAIGLRFGLLKVIEPAPRGPMRLDEPAKMLSGDLVQQIGLLIKDLGEWYDKQVIVVTQHTELIPIADKYFIVEKTKGISRLKKSFFQNDENEPPVLDSQPGE